MASVPQGVVATKDVRGKLSRVFNRLSTEGKAFDLMLFAGENCLSAYRHVTNDNPSIGALEPNKKTAEFRDLIVV